MTKRRRSKSIEDLPDQVLLLFCEWLKHIRDVMSFSQVNRYFYGTIRRNILKLSIPRNCAISKKIQNEDLYFLKSLEQMKNLTYLDFGQNYLYTFNIRIKEFFGAIKDMKNLKHLDISRNIDYEWIRECGHEEILADTIGSLKNLVFLDMSQKRSKEGSELIGFLDNKFDTGCLSNLTKLTHLNLGYIIRGMKGVQDVTKVLENLPKLTYLDLSGIYVWANTPNSPVDASLIISKTLEGLKDLTHLNLFDNICCEYGATELAKRLKFLKKLRYINLGNNMAGSGCIALMDSFKEMENLTHLNLTYNQIGVFAEDITERLKLLKNLTHIDLSYNNICDEGAHYFSESFGHLKYLSLVKFDGNYITCEGHQAILESTQDHNVTIDIYDVYEEEEEESDEGEWGIQGDEIGNYFLH